jgi:RNA polymerase-interacting CarD/CdnL/TRCF family regulator
MIGFRIDTQVVYPRCGIGVIDLIRRIHVARHESLVDRLVIKQNLNIVY